MKKTSHKPSDNSPTPADGSNAAANGRGIVAARSIRSLAKYCGKAESTVRKWLRHEAWVFGRRPPWDVAKVRAWADIHLKADPAKEYHDQLADAESGKGDFESLGLLTRVRAQAVIERTLLIRQKRLLDAGKLHDVDECRQRRLRQIHAVKGALLAMPRSVASSLVGLSRDQVERTLSQRIEEILAEFANG